MDLIRASVTPTDERNRYEVDITVLIAAESLTEALMVVVDVIGAAAMEQT